MNCLPNEIRRGQRYFFPRMFYRKSAGTVNTLLSFAMGKSLLRTVWKSLGHTGVKRVTLQSAERVPEIPDAKNITVENGSVSFLYSGSPKQLLTSLADLSFEDFTVTDPDLEEVFMHYYVKEEN